MSDLDTLLSAVVPMVVGRVAEILRRDDLVADRVVPDVVSSCLIRDHALCVVEPCVPAE